MHASTRMTRRTPGTPLLLLLAHRLKMHHGDTPTSVPGLAPAPEASVIKEVATVTAARQDASVIVPFQTCPPSPLSHNEAACQCVYSLPCPNCTGQRPQRRQGRARGVARQETARRCRCRARRKNPKRLLSWGCAGSKQPRWWATPPRPCLGPPPRLSTPRTKAVGVSMRGWVAGGNHLLEASLSWVPSSPHPRMASTPTS